MISTDQYWSEVGGFFISTDQYWFVIIMIRYDQNYDQCCQYYDFFDQYWFNIDPVLIKCAVFVPCCQTLVLIKFKLLRMSLTIFNSPKSLINCLLSSLYNCCKSWNYWPCHGTFYTAPLIKTSCSRKSQHLSQVTDTVVFLHNYHHVTVV